MEDHAALSSNHSTHTNTFNRSRSGVHMSWWAMNGLERSAEYSLEQKVEMIAEAGFDGINGFIPSSEEAKRWNKLLERYRLTLSVNAHPKTSNAMAILLNQA